MTSWETKRPLVRRATHRTLTKRNRWRLQTHRVLLVTLLAITAACGGAGEEAKAACEEYWIKSNNLSCVQQPTSVSGACDWLPIAITTGSSGADGTAMGPVSVCIDRGSCTEQDIAAYYECLEEGIGCAADGSLEFNEACDENYL